MVHAFYEDRMLLDAPPCAFPARSITGSAPDVKEVKPLVIIRLGRPKRSFRLCGRVLHRGIADACGQRVTPGARGRIGEFLPGRTERKRPPGGLTAAG